MAIHNVIGDSFRGATWVSIHNGGGTGWGESVNGGFGFVVCLPPAPCPCPLPPVATMYACSLYSTPPFISLAGFCNSMVLDGSLDADRRSKSMLHWDVYNGVRAVVREFPLNVVVVV